MGLPKRAYLSRRDAVEALRKRGHTGAVYRCDLCDRWHVGTDGKNS